MPLRRTARPKIDTGRRVARRPAGVWLLRGGVGRGELADGAVDRLDRLVDLRVVDRQRRARQEFDTFSRSSNQQLFSG